MSKTTCNVPAMQRLRWLVENAEADRFDMDRYAHVVYDQFGHTCGTAYCAAGFAAIDPWMQENTVIGKVFRVADRKDGTGFSVEGWLARDSADCYPDARKGLAVVFGISEADSSALFYPGVNSKRQGPKVIQQHVIDNIDRILAGKPAEPYQRHMRVENERR